MKKDWVHSYPLRAQRRLWSDWADAQAYLSLHWAHTHFVDFVMRRLMYAIKKWKQTVKSCRKMRAYSSYVSVYCRQNLQLVRVCFSMDTAFVCMNYWALIDVSCQFLDRILDSYDRHMSVNVCKICIQTVSYRNLYFKSFMGACNFFVLSLCCGSITYKTSIFPTSLLVNFDSNLRTPRGVNLHKALTYRAKFSPVLTDHVTVRLSRLLAYLGSYLWKLVTAVTWPCQPVHGKRLLSLTTNSEKPLNLCKTGVTFWNLDSEILCIAAQVSTAHTEW